MFKNTKERKEEIKVLEETVDFIQKKMEGLGRGFIFVPGVNKEKEFLPGPVTKIHDEVEFFGLLACLIEVTEKSFKNKLDYRDAELAFALTIMKELEERLGKVSRRKRK